MRCIGGVNGEHCESFYAKSNYVVGGSPDADGALLAKFHAVQAERNDCEERYVMVKVVIFFCPPSGLPEMGRNGERA